MNYINQIGVLAFASRLKRLTDRLIQDGEKVYQSQNIQFEPRWFTIFHLLAYHDSPIPVTDIAAMLGISHPAVIQITRTMTREGLLESSKDAKDGRKRLLKLSPKGENLLPALEPIWDDFERATRDLFGEISVDMIAMIEKIEKALDQKEMANRIIIRTKARQYEAVKILDYHPDYRSYFKSLNYEWLQKYFEVEEGDKGILSNPETEILNLGGFIFFGQLDNEIVGTTALFKINDNTFELGKMAVSQKAQGKQVGKKLAHTAIQKARSKGATSIILKTDKKLTAAVRLYRSLGFVMVKNNQTISQALDRAKTGFTMKLDLN